MGVVRWWALNADEDGDGDEDLNYFCRNIFGVAGGKIGDGCMYFGVLGVIDLRVTYYVR